MKLSIIIESMTTKDGSRTFMKASAKAKYLIGAEHLDAKIEENGNLTGADADTHFDVKLVGYFLPKEEGVYELDCESAWKDLREGVKYPTVWCKGINALTKKLDLHKKQQ